MDNYTIYCAKEQTKKALELGAPLIQVPSLSIIPNGSENLKVYKYEDNLYLYPTAEQMISWFEQNAMFKCIQISIDAKPTNWMYAIYYGKDDCIALDGFSSRKEATIAAIDAALDYIEKEGCKR